MVRVVLIEGPCVVEHTALVMVEEKKRTETPYGTQEMANGYCQGRRLQFGVARVVMRACVSCGDRTIIDGLHSRFRLGECQSFFLDVMYRTPRI